jgi:protein gp37
MGQTSGIEWCDATWNPWMGCKRVSPACAYCYADREMSRYGRDFDTITRAKDGTFFAPLKWKQPKRIFTCSWSDWFIEQADDWRVLAWDVIRGTPHHTYLILTKRIERAADHLPADWPLANVWLGVSAENQRMADARIPVLLDIPATVHWISAEPLLGPIDLMCLCGGRVSALDGIDFEIISGPQIAKLDWVVAGGESGTKRRPTDVDWYRRMLAQCRESGAAFFLKQLGGWPNKHGQIEDFPQDLRVREFPSLGKVIA